MRHESSAADRSGRSWYLSRQRGVPYLNLPFVVKVLHNALDVFEQAGRISRLLWLLWAGLAVGVGVRLVSVRAGLVSCGHTSEVLSEPGKAPSVRIDKRRRSRRHGRGRCDDSCTALSSSSGVCPSNIHCLASAEHIFELETFGGSDGGFIDAFVKLSGGLFPQFLGSFAGAESEPR